VQSGETDVAFLDRFLSQKFYHGTARADPAFRKGQVAYLTPTLALAEDHAKMDAGVDGGVPRIIVAKLNVDNPAMLGNIEMQDLHLNPSRVVELVTRGHDCAISGDNMAEIAVFNCDRILVEGELELQPTPHPQ
jgi:hypothetical protein